MDNSNTSDLLGKSLEISVFAQQYDSFCYFGVLRDHVKKI
jgi:hypothetical protein